MEKHTKTRLSDLGILLIIAIFPALLRSIYYAFPGVPAISIPDINFAAFYNAVIDATDVLLMLYILHIRGRSLRDLGWRPAWLDLAFALALAVGATFFYGTLLADVKMVAPRSPALQAQNVGYLHTGFSWGLLVLLSINPFLEELIIRGFLMTEVRAITGSKWWAIGISVLLQTACHFYQGIGHAFLLGSIFLVFAIFYAETRRLVPVVLAHLLLDLAILFR